MTKAMVIDLNCDMGESFGHYSIGNDDSIMPYISSVNIACGFHAGDPAIMAKTVRLAVAHGVAIGAHPGLPDLAGFGRRTMSISVKEAEQITLYQIGALSAFVRVAGGQLHHVKPHGALYNMACHDKALALAIARAVSQFDPSLILYGLAGSELIAAGKDLGLTVANEVFADRRYQSDGALVSRKRAGSVIEKQADVLEQIHRIVVNRQVVSIDGNPVSLVGETLCIHGDSPDSLGFAQAIHLFLQQHNIAIEPVSGH